MIRTLITSKSSKAKPQKMEFQIKDIKTLTPIHASIRGHTVCSFIIFCILLIFLRKYNCSPSIYWENQTAFSSLRSNQLICVYIYIKHLFLNLKKSRLNYLRYLFLFQFVYHYVQDI